MTAAEVACLGVCVCSDPKGLHLCPVPLRKHQPVPGRQVPLCTWAACLPALTCWTRVARCPGLGRTPPSGPGGDPAQPPPAPGRGGGGAGRGLPGGAAVPPSGGLQQAPLRSASRGCRPAGKCRRGCRPQRCCAEEEGSPPRGSLCLHWCFLPDSDCFALGSWLSALCLRPAPQEPAGQGGFGDGGRVASPWHPRNGTA